MGKGSIVVSVIIPLFNQKRFVGDAIESVLNQNCEKLEILVVNDGSTDNPETVLKKFGKEIKVINQQNSGLSAARNCGIKNSRGKFIQFLDADDILLPDKISTQLKFNIDNGADISYCKLFVTDTKKKHFRPLESGPVEDIFYNYYYFWKPYPTPIHSMLVNRDIFNKYGLFDESLRANEDRSFFCMLAAGEVDFKYLNIYGGLYRLHGNSMNRDMGLMIRSAVDFYRVINRKLGEKFIKEKTGFSGEEIMRANLTYLYLINLRKGLSKMELKNLKNIIVSEGIDWFTDPIPSKFRKNKFLMMKLSSYFWRYAGIMGLIKKGELEL